MAARFHKNWVQLLIIFLEPQLITFERLKQDLQFNAAYIIRYILLTQLLEYSLQHSFIRSHKCQQQIIALQLNKLIYYQVCIRIPIYQFKFKIMIISIQSDKMFNTMISVPQTVYCMALRWFFSVQHCSFTQLFLQYDTAIILSSDRINLNPLLISLSHIRPPITLCTYLLPTGPTAYLSISTDAPQVLWFCQKQSKREVVMLSITLWTDKGGWKGLQQIRNGSTEVETPFMMPSPNLANGGHGSSQDEHEARMSPFLGPALKGMSIRKLICFHNSVSEVRYPTESRYRLYILRCSIKLETPAWIEHHRFSQFCQSQGCPYLRQINQLSLIITGDKEEAAPRAERQVELWLVQAGNRGRRCFQATIQQDARRPASSQYGASSLQPRQLPKVPSNRWFSTSRSPNSFANLEGVGVTSNAASSTLSSMYNNISTLYLPSISILITTHPLSATTSPPTITPHTYPSFSTDTSHQQVSRMMAPPPPNPAQTQRQRDTVYILV